MYFSSKTSPAGALFKLCYKIWRTVNDEADTKYQFYSLYTRIAILYASELI
jgi:hypothetical protein